MEFITGYQPKEPTWRERALNWLRVNTLSKLTVIICAGPLVGMWL